MTWRDYATERPPAAGEYLWRIPSNAIPGMFVLARAKYRVRGAGIASVLSPEFDYWDGYRVHVVAGAQWREVQDADPQLAPEGVTLDPCPYCGDTPTWSAVQRIPGATVCGGKPQDLNTWWCRCCAWGQSPHLADPREIARARSAALAKMREGVAQ